MHPARKAIHPPPRRSSGRPPAGAAGVLASGLLAGLLALSCAHDPGPAQWEAWQLSPPFGCALGRSGATLYPGEALRQARRDALVQLVRRFDESRVRARSIEDEQGRLAWVHQESTGRLARIQVVAMWTGRRGGGGDVYAMACEEGADPGPLPGDGLPGWLLNPPDTAQRLCAPAVAGPTLEPEDQRPAALEDGRRALAEAFESRVDQILVDDEGARTYVLSQIEPTAAALEAAAQARELEAEWLDRRGHGPLGVRRTLYALVCVPR